MLKWQSLVLGTVSLSAVAALSLHAAAQTDGAPVPLPAEPPGAPMPGDPPAAPPAEPPAAPPATPAPPVEPAPPAEPPPAAPPANPPSGEFPLPPSAPHTAKRRAAPRPEGAPPAADTPPPAAETPAKKPSEGLFEDKPRANGEPPPAPKKSDDDDDHTDQFKIGPVVGIGLPSIISVGGTMKVTRFLGAGVNFGLIPTVQLNYYGKATLSYKHLDFYGRLYPFGGGFFLQGGAGYATVNGSLHSSYSQSAAMLPVAIPGFPTSASGDYDGNGSTRTLMLTALLGYFYTTSIGFSFGVDAGVQLPIAPSQVAFSSTLKTTPSGIDALPPVAAYKKDADDQVRSTLEKIGRTPLPTINLRIGWIL